MEPDKKPTLGFWLKVVIAIITGIASALGVSAAMRAADMQGVLSSIM